mgnify:CR=1 FL=1
MSLRIAIPNKGRLQQPVLQFLADVGIKPLMSNERALIVPTNWEGVQLVMVRTEDIPSIVETGAAELGITGHDYVVESGADVEELLRLDFGSAKMVLAVPVSWNISSPEEIRGEVRIATKYINIARRYVEERGIRARLVKVSGAAEVMPSLGAADAIIDVMSTGTTLRLHGLKPIDVVMETSAVVISNRDWAGSGEHERINIILTLMKGVLSARGKKMLFMNVPNESLEKVLSVLPAMLSPAISKLANTNAWEVITVVDEDRLPEVVGKAVANGARDIVVINMEKVIG